MKYKQYYELTSKQISELIKSLINKDVDDALISNYLRTHDLESNYDEFILLGFTILDDKIKMELRTKWIYRYKHMPKLYNSLYLQNKNGEVCEFCISKIDLCGDNTDSFVSIHCIPFLSNLNLKNLKIDVGQEVYIIGKKL